ncbi:MAG: transglycosylase domain-containing protein [Bacilli bacterium]|nr:transglycosylase domain-containing protein [Bacilli bacterium]MDD3895714.1 transglycosylase domain-containing protein [Bacilli bacterium]MDD4407464.1 transglycosylase domain-containing protein [Bacilli bacterium]
MKRVNFIIKLTIFLFICVTIVISGLYTYAYFSDEITLNSANRVQIYDYKNDIVYQGSGDRKWVKLNDISDYVKEAIVSVEDKNFYKHNGFDYLRIIKSFFNNFKEQKIIAGASTISMQYVKNMYLDFDQTWERKIEEAFLTINLETHYTKDEILEGYLNTINFGRGNFGIESASQYYFNKKSSDLTLEEAIILVGIPRSPENYNPISNYDLSISRGKNVAKSMIKNKYLTKEEYNNLFQNQLITYGKKEINNSQTFMYYHDAVMQELNSIKTIPKSLIKYGGIKIFTNYNLDIQTKMETSITENITDENVQTASVVIDPKTGGITALSGGVDYTISQYNRASKAERQVGSIIKPFLYYAALENNMTSTSTFKSEVTSFVFADNETYSPTNYANSYANKEITMAAAIAYSDNIYAVKTHLFLGENTLVDSLKLAGLEKNIKPNPSLALGATELNMLDIAQAYNTIANYGTYNKLFFINKVEDLEGNILYEHKLEPDEVLNKDYVYILNEMLTTTYNPSFIDYMSPTVYSLNSRITKKYALKSGTTDYDYWFVGYNPNLLMLVWSGNDNNKSVDKSYSSKIKSIWCDTSEYALKNMENTWYEPSENIIALPLNAITGNYTTNNKNTTLFYFKKGSEPLKE